MKRGTIVLINASFSDLSATKIRPALVISNEGYNIKQDDVVLILMSSNISRSTPDDYVLEDSNPEFKTTGLIRSSTFRTGKIITLKKDLLRNTLGFVGPNTLNQIEKRLRKLLPL
ncbi:MAG: type II toxin-antitoxin system PemK/MazF family toxin [Candidatus Scalindua sediminis]|nr:type II toxin-antitoxin system PemK/MazF family toxin [Candidatus Scalindua sediminis]